jgi:hypothetical protein
LWEFLPLPGIEHVREDGTSYINNTSVAVSTAVCMMNGCDQQERSWEFMKWYTGADCQIRYSNEMVAILGPSAKPACANKNALSQMPWTSEEYKQIEYQSERLASIPNYPGSYIIGRYTSFSFLAAYNDKADPVDELQSYISIINKEITRKREEFGLETLDTEKKQSTLAVKRMQEAEAALDEARQSANYSSTYDKVVNSVLKEIKDYETEDYAEIEALSESLRKLNGELFKTAADKLDAAAKRLREYEQYK